MRDFFSVIVMSRILVFSVVITLLSSCVMQEGSGDAMGERTGRIARKSARETKRFFSGIARGWREEGTPSTTGTASPAPATQPYAYPQAPQPAPLQ
jgi:hypothetical protein